MAKAYDRVEWDYLQGIMLKLGFQDCFPDYEVCEVSIHVYKS